MAQYATRLGTYFDAAAHSYANALGAYVQSTGSSSAAAPGGVGTGIGSGTGGEASSPTFNGAAPGGTGTANGVGYGGSATGTGADTGKRWATRLGSYFVTSLHSYQNGFGALLQAVPPADAAAPAGTGVGIGIGSGGVAAGNGDGSAPGGYGVGTGVGTGGVAFGGTSVFTVKTDGIWTWYTDPRAVHYNGNTYIGSINSAGDVCITKWNDAAKTGSSFTLSAAFQLDDHNNAGIHVLPDGRIVAMYCRHNDYTATFFRISTNPEDITAWGAETAVSGGLPITYTNLHYLSDSGKTYNHYRSGPGGAGTNPINARATSDWSSWDVERTWITQTGSRPYVKSVSNGVDRIDFFFTNCHPNEGAASLYHCYMKLVAGVETFYKSDGTLINNTGSITPAMATLIYDGTTVEAWTWEINYGADGNPRVLFVRYPTTSDQRLCFSRWTGTSWTAAVEIAVGGAYLYAAEANYSGGLCFDSLDTNIVFLSTPVSGVREIQEWTTTDNGATWSKRRDITTGTSAGVINARPYSPRNRSSKLAVIYWTGTYSTFNSYNTNLMSAEGILVSGTAPAGTGTGTGIGAGGEANATSTQFVSITNSQQVNTAAAVAIKQTHKIGIASSQQAIAAAAIAIRQTHKIGIANSQQTNTASTGSVSQSSTIFVAATNSQQVNQASPVGIRQTHRIGIANSVQLNTCSPVSVLPISGSFSGSLSDADIDRIAAAVWAYANRVITGPTAEQNADALLSRTWP